MLCVINGVKLVQIVAVAFNDVVLVMLQEKRFSKVSASGTSSGIVKAIKI